LTVVFDPARARNISHGFSHRIRLSIKSADKLQLVQDLWDDLAAAPGNVPVYDWQIEERERRRKKLQSNPSSAIPWDEFDRQLRERYGS
jgi:putative addiction module component (TIGR02574 family)